MKWNQTPDQARRREAEIALFQQAHPTAPLHGGGRRRAPGLAALVALLAFLAGSASAQYQIWAWENFEDGKFPASMKRGHDANEENANVFDFMSKDAPPGILEGRARTECGHYGVRFQTTSEKKFLSILSGLALEREKLGAMGRALFQADFFTPPDYPVGSNMAVLSSMPPTDGKTALWQIYRFGQVEGRKFFFSFTNKKAEPDIYKEDVVAAPNTPKTGWHRYQIIFEGQENIYCAIDGAPTTFSPIKEPTFKMLQAGIMVTSKPETTGYMYADNLSIQWTPEDVPLPDSPWVATPIPASAPGAVPGAAPGAAPGVSQPSPSTAFSSGPAFPLSPAGGGGGIEWLYDPEEAWQRSRTLNRPLLTLFYAPRARANLVLERILQSDQNTLGIFRQCVALRIDVNQLSGGAIAKHFGIYRVPSFVVFGQDAKIKGLVFFEQMQPWEQTLQTIQSLAGIAPPSAPAPANPNAPGNLGYPGAPFIPPAAASGAKPQGGGSAAPIEPASAGPNSGAAAPASSSQSPKHYSSESAPFAARSAPAPQSGAASAADTSSKADATAPAGPQSPLSASKSD